MQILAEAPAVSDSSGLQEHANHTQTPLRLGLKYLHATMKAVNLLLAAQKNCDRVLLIGRRSQFRPSGDLQQLLW